MMELMESEYYPRRLEMITAPKTVVYINKNTSLQKTLN